MQEEAQHGNQKARQEMDLMKRDLDKRTEEAGVLKAKLFLDLVQISFKIVPEYPDMVEENHELQRGLAEMEKTIELQKEVKGSLER